MSTPRERGSHGAQPRSFDVHLDGMIRGADAEGAAQLTIAPPNLEVATTTRLIVVRLDSLDGVEVSGARAEIFLASGDVLGVEAGAATSDFAGALIDAALALPELTVSLRSYGSPRAGAGAEQEVFFAPLRQALERTAAFAAAADATDVFAAERLANELSRQLARLAMTRYPSHPPERRALEAELTECAATVQRRLEVLGEAQQQFRDAPGGERFAAWRRWTEALLDVFSAHDACWPLVRVALDSAPAVTEAPTGIVERFRVKYREGGGGSGTGGAGGGGGGHRE